MQDILMFLMIIFGAFYLWSSFQISEEVNSTRLEMIEPPQQRIETRMVQKIKPPKELFTVDQEIEMACEETDCVRTCRTTTPAGETYHDPKCVKECAKERCKKRCKKEPVMTFGERGEFFSNS